jgi:hypothetical protein
VLIAGLAADGSLSADAAANAGALLDQAKAHYLAKRYTDAIPLLNAIVDLAGAEAAGTADARAELAAQARALREWMQQRNSAS